MGCWVHCLELVSPPAQFGFIASPQIGLARGQARTGDYGSAARRSYGVIGNDAVLAARLMTAAPPGQIRCSHSIYALARARVEFESLPSVRVKGRAELVRVYRPVGQRSAASDQPPAAGQPALVGRLAEIAQLEASLDKLQAGQASGFMGAS